MWHHLFKTRQNITEKKNTKLSCEVATIVLSYRFPSLIIRSWSGRYFRDSNRRFEYNSNRSKQCKFLAVLSLNKTQRKLGSLLIWWQPLGRQERQRKRNKITEHETKIATLSTLRNHPHIPLLLQQCHLPTDWLRAKAALTVWINARLCCLF